jgi:hypothetical protein
MSTLGTTSEYLLLFRGSDWDQALSPTELQAAMSGFLAWFERLQAEGILKTGQPLMDEGRVVSGKSGRTIADGPFAESKETIGGYFLITAGSLDQATEIACQCPILEYGTAIEVRPVAADCPTLQRARKILAEELAGAAV